MRPSMFLIGLITLFVSVAITPIARAENGITDNQILIGRVQPITGPAAGIAAAMMGGSELYIDKINKAGGVHGRKIKIITVDDAFDPRLSVQQATKLINEDKVFAIFEMFGGATTSSVIPLIKNTHVPLIASFTGLESIRNPVVPEIYNVRGSFFQESEGLVKEAYEKLGIKDIGVFYQDDAYGNSGKAGVAKALSKYGAKIKASGEFHRGTIDIDKALDDLMKGGAKAVVAWALPDSTAAIITKAAAKGYYPTFLLSSSLGAPNVLAALKDKVAYISVTTPLSTEKSFAFVNSFVEDVNAAGKPDLLKGLFGLQAYVDSIVLVEALKNAGKNLNYQTLREGFYKIDGHDIGGVKIKFGPNNHQAFPDIFIRKISSGKVTID